MAKRQVTTVQIFPLLNVMINISIRMERKHNVNAFIIFTQVKILEKVVKNNLDELKMAFLAHQFKRQVKRLLSLTHVMEIEYLFIF
jgi:hypothetical protein